MQKVIMFHGTKCLTAIAQEGVLWGRHRTARFTHLAATPLQAAQYGPEVLAVEFYPDHDWPNNWDPDAWQCRVDVPIPLSRLRVISQEIY